MSDASLRAIERAVELDPKNEGSRMELTAAMIRAGRGHVAWWYGRERVHPSAAKVRLESSFQNELTKEWATDGMGGWAVAVASPRDLIELASVHRTATLLDLETGRWARFYGALTPATRAAVETSTVDALGRSRSVRASATARDERMTPLDYPMPPPAWGQGPIAVRWRSEPLFDTEYVPEGRGSQQVNLFQNFGSFTHTPSAPRDFGGFAKAWGIDTNLSGQGGNLPVTWCAHVLGVSVSFMDEHRRPLPRAACEEIATNGTVNLELVTTTIAAIPLREALAVADEPASEESGVVVPWQPPPVYPLAWPVAIQALEAFRLRVIFGAERPPFYMRGTLHGFVGKGVTG